MSIEPLKQELESIDQELESAMLRLAETSQRVDELLAGFESLDPEDRKAPLKLAPQAHMGEAEEGHEDSGEDEEDEPGDESESAA